MTHQAAVASLLLMAIPARDSWAWLRRVADWASAQSDGRLCPLCTGQLGFFESREQLRAHLVGECDVVLLALRSYRQREVEAAAGKVSVPAKPEEQRRGFIYLMRCASSSLLKVGLSAQPGARLRSLQYASGAPIELLATIPVQDMGAAERSLHRRFAHLHHHGEWFRAEPEIYAAFGVPA